MEKSKWQIKEREKTKRKEKGSRKRESTNTVNTGRKRIRKPRSPQISISTPKSH